MIRNPILPGFNADPSFVRVGDDWYIATSTFQWYPGVQIHHSRDLANWTLAARPLDRAGLLDMRGNPDDCGIWAPCLSHDGDRFWLVYTDVKRHAGAFKDAHNFITHAERIEGPWSDPIYVNSTGFDASLFHDEDGRKWFVQMRWNHRGDGTGCNPAHDAFDGIMLHEWSEARGLIGEAVNIYAGTERGLTEAPHLFRRDGWYYLTTAEGGTTYDHAVTLARSRRIEGPYETHPDRHVMTTRDAPDHPLQRTGHGQYVEGPDGQGWHTFLMGRPMTAPNGTRNCPMGRETGISRVEWRDGWMYLEGGGMLPPVEVEGPAQAQRGPVVHERFESLPPEFQWLRTPHPERLFRIEDGALILTGREGIGSWFEQALVARRQEDFAYRAETSLDFTPTTYQQAAGLATYYDRHRFHAAVVTHEGGRRCLTLVSCNGDWPDGALDWPIDPVPIPDGPVALAVEVDHLTQQFHWAPEGAEWTPLGPPREAWRITDEGGREPEHSSFTGAFVGMLAYDITGQGAEARFDRFAYTPDREEDT